MLQRSTRFSTLLGLAGLLAMTCSPSASYGQRPGQGGQSGRSQVSSAFNRSSPGIGESIPERFYKFSGRRAVWSDGWELFKKSPIYRCKRISL